MLFDNVKNAHETALTFQSNLLFKLSMLDEVVTALLEKKTLIFINNNNNESGQWTVDSEQCQRFKIVNEHNIGKAWAGVLVNILSLPTLLQQLFTRFFQEDWK